MTNGKRENHMRNIGFSAGVEYKGKVYFAAWEHNAFCWARPEDGEVHFISFFEEEEMIPRLYSAAFLFKDEVWFMPCTARHIVCVNLVNYEMTFYDIQFNQKREYSVEGSYFAFYQGIFDNDRDKLYFLPGCIDSMTVIDVKTHMIEWVPSVIQIEGTDRDEAVKSAILKNGKVLLFGQNKAFYEVFDPDERTIEVIKCSNCLEVNGLPFKLGNGIGFTYIFGKRIPVFHEADHTITYLDTPDDENSFAGVMDFGNELLLLPFVSMYFLVINKATNEVRKFIPTDDWILNEEYSAIREIVPEKMAVSSMDGTIVIFDRVDCCRAYRLSWETMWGEYCAELKKFPSKMNSIFGKGQLADERDYPLDTFLRYVCDS